MYYSIDCHRLVFYESRNEIVSTTTSPTWNSETVMLETRADHWRLVLKIAAPATASLAALVIVMFPLLSETEFRLFDHGDAPEDRPAVDGDRCCYDTELCRGSDYTPSREPCWSRSTISTILLGGALVRQRSPRSARHSRYSI